MRLFQRETGLSFRGWRQRMRLLSSLQALEQGQSVTQAALGCGYESTSAFIVAFKGLFGATPGNCSGSECLPCSGSHEALGAGGIKLFGHYRVHFL